MIAPDKYIAEYSGGKDSTAMLYHLRDKGMFPQTDVAFCNTGAILPENEAFVEETCKKVGANLIIVRPPMDVKQFTEIDGYPSDVVPTEATQDFVQILNGPEGPLVQSYPQCCGNMIWFPLDKYVRENGYNKVFRGSKRADKRVGAPDGYTYNGITYLSPLWNWTDEDVYGYLARESVKLPRHYQYFNDSLDCWICTAHLNHCGSERVRFIRDHYPDLWPELQRRLRHVEDVLLDHVGRATKVLELGDG